MGAVGSGPRRVRARGRARGHRRRDGAVRPQVAAADHALDAFGLDRRAASRLPPAPTRARPVAEPQRPLAIPAGVPGQAPPFRQSLAQTILVPFPVQSPLSGDRARRHAGVVPANLRGPRCLGLATRDAQLSARSAGRRHVYVNGRLAGTHRGDYDSFSLDITRLLHRRGPNHLLVGFFDPIGGADEPVGKQVPGTPGGHLPHGIERHLADGVARAGRLQGTSPRWI